MTLVSVVGTIHVAGGEIGDCPCAVDRDADHVATGEPDHGDYRGLATTSSTPGRRVSPDSWVWVDAPWNREASSWSRSIISSRLASADSFSPNILRGQPAAPRLSLRHVSSGKLLDQQDGATEDLTTKELNHVHQRMSGDTTLPPL